MPEYDINLEPNKYISSCDDKDIISFNSKNLFYIHQVLKLIPAAFELNLMNTVSNYISQKLDNKCNTKMWFDEGEECEILKAKSSGWQKGKLKLRINLFIEFIPDEPEEIKSPLDDVRQEIDNVAS